MMLSLMDYLFFGLIGVVVTIAAFVLWNNICQPLPEEEPDEELFHD